MKARELEKEGEDVCDENWHGVERKGYPPAVDPGSRGQDGGGDGERRV